MDNQQQKDLIDKYLAGNCSEQEREAIESWYLLHAKAMKDAEQKSDEIDFAAEKDQIWHAIGQQINPAIKFLSPRMIIATSAFLSFGVGTYVLLH